MKPTRHGFPQYAGQAKRLALPALLLLAGCCQFPMSAAVQTPVIARGVAEQPGYLPSAVSAPASGMPAATMLPPSQVPPEMIDPEHRPLPITLDTVLALAHDQNGKIQMAREQLREAFAGKDLADKRWLPDLYLGTSYYRHEGGIQDFSGNLVHSSFGSFFAGPELRSQFDIREFAFQKIDAERKIWQKRGEMSQLTSENLLEATSTYVDFLASRSGEAIAGDLKKEMEKLLVRAQELAKAEPGLRVEAIGIQSEIRGQQQIIRKLQQSTRAAAAKLIYLLGLDPNAELVPLDRQLVIFEPPLVNDALPVDALVELALTAGPGVRELQGLLALIDQANEKAQGPGRYLPVMQMNVAEGVFGAGPGSSSTWDNRLDINFQLRWNLTEFLTARERRRIALSKMQQAQLGYQDLRAKLTLGVREAREASQSGRDQASLGESQVRNAAERFDLSHKRFINSLKGASPSEVLMGIRALGGARLNYLNAIRDHDKAQLRLFILTGQVDRGHCAQ